MILEAFVFSFLFGYERFQFEQEFVPSIDQPWYYTVEMGVAWQPLPFFEIYGGIKSDFVADDDTVYYVTFHSRYTIGTTLSYAGFEIGFEHMCGHPETPYGFAAGTLYDEGRERVWVAFRQ